MWAILGWGCHSEPGALGFGDNFSGDFDVVLTDTTSVKVSTVLLDSIPTSSTGMLLVGGYTDPRLGKLTATGYCQLLNTSWLPATGATFDSLVLIANYYKKSGATANYYFGDTTQTQIFAVHRVLNDFKTHALPMFWVNEGQYSALYKDNSLFNTTTHSVDPTPLGSRAIRLRPTSTDSLRIRLSDMLGREWLESTQAQLPTLLEQARFLEYFKGISIVNASANPSVVVAINPENLKIRLYYKQYVSDKLVQLHQDFTFNSALYNHSAISADRSATLLKDLTPEHEVANSVTNNEVYIQAGTGVVTKIRFPYVRKTIDLSEVFMVNHAQLVIEPVKETFDKNRPYPRTLTLYLTDKSNLPLQQLAADYQTGVAQSATFGVDNELQLSSGYTFTITQYVQKLLNTEGNLDNGLLIMPLPADINTGVEKVNLSAGTSDAYRVKLNVWYTRSKQ
ncbi:DUF4270 family protein [Chryseolinea lacunae]|uniref:DUF4270 family protein n=1 Tax=Chryseolinea lacunae TaxID=2801331 RepID=A0ABS1KLA6_9BACT|nr:DUF4270 family protein [Chryseolinea lacunae]